MSATDVLKQVERCGAQVGLEGGRLYVEPLSVVPPDLLTGLREHKSELRELLEERLSDSLGGADAASLTASEICEMPLSEFAEARLVVEVASRVLKETVLFASNNSTVDPGEHRPIYRASELRALVGLSAADLSEVHRIKKTFRGTILA